MQPSQSETASNDLWTLKKAVTTLAIAPETESLTRNGRLAYNVMIFKAQRMLADEEGGFSAPISEIVKGFGATTRDSNRIRAYIEQMCRTVVRWFPLSRTDEIQASIAGLDEPPSETHGDGRIFSLLAEARMWRRNGEQWVTWFYPPTIRDMLIQPARWAQIDIKELASLSHYAAIALFEICARYKDVPGGLTNRAEPGWWTQTLKSDPETKPREWRKFKNETLKPAIAEINLRTGIDVKLIEHKQGRAVVSVQFSVKRKPRDQEPERADLGLLERAVAVGIRERELDVLIDEFGQERVENAMDALEGRLRAQPSAPITNRFGYLRKTLRNASGTSLFDPRPEETPTAPASMPMPVPGAEGHVVRDWVERRFRQINAELDALSTEDLERFAELAAHQLSSSATDLALKKRFANRQYRSPLIWARIRATYATETYGPAWDQPPSAESVPAPDRSERTEEPSS